MYQARNHRGSRTDVSNFLGLATLGDREVSVSETRRETKQEREARKLEKERVAREKERQRSMWEEHVDGGYLVTQGVYTGPEDYDKVIVRRLMVSILQIYQDVSNNALQIERRLAPFWRGLQDHSDSWAEHQLVSAARGLPIPAADEAPTESPSPPVGASIAQIESQGSEGIKPTVQLTVPLAPRSRSLSSEASVTVSSGSPSASTSTQGGSSLLTLPSGSPIDPLSRVRAKTLASLQSSSKGPPPEPLPRELRLPANPTINGQPIEAYLYKDASECPICFLYYPPYLNKTRCCDQAICSECFVQIKRPDPHPPEHIDPTSPGNEQPPQEPSTDGELVSEPATCPFCKQPEFGISYERPPFQRGLAYVNQSIPASGDPGMSSNISLASGRSNSPRRKAMSLSASASTVITTDHVRPNWEQKLTNARMHQARRSAAATALHTAAYMMGGRGYDEGRFHFGRRGLLRRMSTADSPTSSNPHFNIISMLSENHRNSSGRRDNGEGDLTSNPRGNESSRNRVDDLEEMMMMEAIRLSLASEEERRKKEEKEARKDAKKKDKEAKKAEKVARKAGIVHNLAPTGAVQTGKGKQPQQFDGETDEGDAENADSPFRGRTTAQTTDAQTYLERARNQIQPMDYPTGRPGFGSHFRESSYASSTDNDSIPGSLGFQGSRSSLELSANANLDDLTDTGPLQGNSSGSTPPKSGNSMEPMVNFSSLAAMVDKGDSSGTAKQDVDSGMRAVQRANNHRKELHADSEDEQDECFYDTHTSTDVKVPAPTHVDDHVIHQQS